jgi:hypothetical protein
MSTSLFICREVLMEDVGKEKHLHNKKEYKKFYQDHYPHSLTPSHTSKSLIVKANNFFYDIHIGLLGC